MSLKPLIYNDNLVEPQLLDTSPLFKRHNGEGTRRRNRLGRRKRVLPPELRACTDSELDSRNERIWHRIHYWCQIVADVPPNAYPPTNARDAIGRRYVAAKRAALWLCNRNYGIPNVRLAELAESTRQWIGGVVREPGPHAQAVIDGWRSRGGAALLADTQVATIQVTKETHDALLAFVGDRDACAVASALLLAVLHERFNQRATAPDCGDQVSTDACGVTQSL